jgi:teichuronic acid biosynthesis glycosyltransferase TuaC
MGMSSRPLRVLTFTSLFPNEQQSLHGVFVGARIKALAGLCDLRVVAPVPWAPPIRLLGERYYRYSRIPREEFHEGLPLKHPRFLVFPKCLKSTDGMLMAACSLRLLKAMRQSFPFDVIDAHWAYPDGFAAAVLANFFHVPLALTVRGDDINILPEFFLRRQSIRWALQRASLVIALSNELKERVQLLTNDVSKTVVIPNGVNSEIFCPGDRSEARRRLGLSREGRILLSVGRLHSSKGYPLLVEALGQLQTQFPDLSLVIVGESDNEADARWAIDEAAIRLGITEKVKLVGAQPHSVVADWYRAADLFCLPTSREGSANVLLEALACGLPCVTTPVGGNRDIITNQEVGILVSADVEFLTCAIAQGLGRHWDRERIAGHVRKRTWASVASECYENLSRVVTLDSETPR